MRPRKTLDTRWRNLGLSVAASLFPPDRRRTQAQVENAWPGRAALATLSVRSGLDLLLQCLKLPAGSEVLVSAITIRDIPIVLRHHGLRIVPVDIDPDTCAVDTTELAAKVTPRTRAILVAHLFGARMPMRGIAEIARRQGLLLIEDCAQAYAADGYRGDDESDVAMFSFGPIKTATALGGGVLCFRDPALRDACAALQATWPMQSRAAYLRRSLKYMLLKALSHPLAYTAFTTLCRWTGRNHDQLISTTTRGFPGSELLPSLRHQPCTPLLAAMARQLCGKHGERIAARIAAAEAFQSHAGSTLTCIGVHASPHAHWVFPIASRDPDALVHWLWQHGFDATRGATSLHVVSSDDPESDATPQAHRIMACVVYLPVETATPAGIAALASLVVAFETHGVA